jgi:hypothetical protein
VCAILLQQNTSKSRAQNKLALGRLERRLSWEIWVQPP